MSCDHVTSRSHFHFAAQSSKFLGCLWKHLKAPHWRSEPPKATVYATPCKPNFQPHCAEDQQKHGLRTVMSYSYTYSYPKLLCSYLCIQQLDPNSKPSMSLSKNVTKAPHLLPEPDPLRSFSAQARAMPGFREDGMSKSWAVAGPPGKGERSGIVLKSSWGSRWKFCKLSL